MQRVTLEQDDIENSLAEMSEEQIDALTFGAIQVDEKGKILYYSAREEEITGRKSSDLVGKNFFDDVAPCTDRPEFRGKFDEGVANGQLQAVFDYVFDYEMNPTKVRVHMKHAIDKKSVWIFVKRL